eukprot:ANDGO_04709.mRNA.1 hypothetical protein
MAAAGNCENASWWEELERQFDAMLLGMVEDSIFGFATGLMSQLQRVEVDTTANLNLEQQHHRHSSTSLSDDIRQKPKAVRSSHRNSFLDLMAEQYPGRKLDRKDSHVYNSGMLLTCNLFVKTEIVSPSKQNSLSVLFRMLRIVRCLLICTRVRMDQAGSP